MKHVGGKPRQVRAITLMGFPVPLWKDFLWAWLHRSAKELDALVAVGSSPSLAEIVRWLKVLALLLPCEICGKHFAEVIATDFDVLSGKKPAMTYFQWTVDVRRRISVRTGRPIRTFAYCDYTSAWLSPPLTDFATDLPPERRELEVRRAATILNDPDALRRRAQWFGMAWNALQIISFAYLPAAPGELQIEVDFFMRFTAKLFPNADEFKWGAILDDQNARFADMPSNPPLITRDVLWCGTRERMMLTVYRLRSEAQTDPVLNVLPLNTIVQQWVHQLSEFVTQFRAAQQKQNEAIRLQQEAAAKQEAQEKALAPQTAGPSSDTNTDSSAPKPLATASTSNPLAIASTPKPLEPIASKETTTASGPVAASVARLSMPGFVPAPTFVQKKDKTLDKITMGKFYVPSSSTHSDSSRKQRGSQTVIFWSLIAVAIIILLLICYAWWMRFRGIELGALALAPTAASTVVPSSPFTYSIVTNAPLREDLRPSRVEPLVTTLVPPEAAELDQLENAGTEDSTDQKSQDEPTDDTFFEDDDPLQDLQ